MVELSFRKIDETGHRFVAKFFTFEQICRDITAGVFDQPLGIHGATLNFPADSRAWNMFI